MSVQHQQLQNSIFFNERKMMAILREDENSGTRRKPSSGIQAKNGHSARVEDYSFSTNIKEYHWNFPNSQSRKYSDWLNVYKVQPRKREKKKKNIIALT